MAETVTISFVAGGISEVTRAFESVEKSLLKLQRAAERDSAKLGKDQVRAAMQSGKERERILVQELKNRNRLEVEAARNVNKLSIEGAKAYERAEKEKTRIFLQQERERQRAAQHSQQQAARSAAATQQSFRSVLAGGAAVTRGVGNVAKLGGLALTAGGGLAISDAFAYDTAGERKAAQISNQIQQFSKQKVSNRDIQMLARAAQAKSGVKSNDLMAGFSDYLAASSDFDPSNKGKSADMMAFLGKISQATGSDVGDVFRTAGTLKSQNKNMTDEQLKGMFLSVVSQGAEGAVELRDLAKYSEKITSSSAQYQGNQAQNQAKLMGLAQLVKPISPTGEIGSSIEHFASDAQNATHRKKIARALGADLYNDKGQIKSPEELLLRGIDYAKGDVSKLQALGFGERGIDVFRAMGGTYNEASNGTKGSKAQKHAAAMAAVRAKVERQLGAAGYTEGDLNSNVANVRGTRDAKIAETMQNLRDKIADNLLPVLDKWIAKMPEIVPKIEKLVDALGKVADWLGENPWKGLAGVVSLAIGREIGLSGVASMLKASFTAVGAGGAAGTGARGFGAATSGAGAVGVPLALAVGGLIQSGTTVSEVYGALTSKDGKSKAQSDLSDWRAGKMDTEAVDGLREQAKQKGKFDSEDFMKSLPFIMQADSLYGAVTGNKGSMFGGKRGTEIMKDKVDAIDYLNSTAGFKSGQKNNKGEEIGYGSKEKADGVKKMVGDNTIVEDGKANPVVEAQKAVTDFGTSITKANEELGNFIGSLKDAGEGARDGSFTDRPKKVK